MANSGLAFLVIDRTFEEEPNKYEATPEGDATYDLMHQVVVGHHGGGEEHDDDNAQRIKGEAEKDADNEVEQKFGHFETVVEAE